MGSGNTTLLVKDMLGKKVDNVMLVYLVGVSAEGPIHAYSATLPTDQVRSSFRGRKINANFFCTKFFDNPSGHGRPRRKSWTSAPKSAFSCGPGGGEKHFDPWASGRKGQECPREIRTKKFMFMLFFVPWVFLLPFSCLSSSLAEGRIITKRGLPAS